jgi:hypothetical protein
MLHRQCQCREQMGDCSVAAAESALMPLTLYALGCKQWQSSCAAEGVSSQQKL